MHTCLLNLMSFSWPIEKVRLQRNVKKNQFGTKVAKTSENSMQKLAKKWQLVMKIARQTVPTGEDIHSLVPQGHFCCFKTPRWIL